MSVNLESLMQVFGGDVLEKMSGQIGADKNQTQAALGSVLPLLVSAMAKNSATPQGASALQGAIEKDHDGSILNNLSGFLGGGGAESAGAGILGHILGGNQNSVQKYVSEDSGLSSDAVGSLMKMAAPILMGSLGAQSKSSGGGIGDLLGALSGQVAQKAPESQGIFAQLLDSNNDGSVVDDVAKLGMSMLENFFK